MFDDLHSSNSPKVELGKPTCQIPGQVGQLVGHTTDKQHQYLLRYLYGKKIIE
jgi:hypothetical protein